MLFFIQFLFIFFLPREAKVQITFSFPVFLFLERTHSPSSPPHPLKLKKLLQHLHRLFRVLHRMSRRARILENLIIVTAFVCLVAEEVNGRVIDAREVFLVGQMLQAICLVPAFGKHVEGDLSADGVSDQ